MSKVATFVLCFAASIILNVSLLNAQAAPLPRHPGDVIKYEIKFDGPNADRIKTVNAGLNITATVPKDQSGFAQGIGDNNVQPSSPSRLLKN